ncbi:ghrelin/obestatin prepropeptide [Megalops cyprinoides]|uniref:ghrelin/obestatin prepropeptide n=1 Tax=Megalops cyprinoides TaxID=118141 RepID=UPI001864D656|nr:ghrelin/obestatin prepropeptide [Megalops cyprinoides]
MQLMKGTAYGILLVCVLALWTDSVQAGSSFLSPSQKPQGKMDKKPPRVGRRDSDGILNLFESRSYEEEDGKHVTFNTPFEIAITMTEGEFHHYGEVLQKIMQDLLVDTPAAD